MLQREHSAILLTFIKIPFVIKIFVVSIFEWPLKTGFTNPKDRFSRNEGYIMGEIVICSNVSKFYYNCRITVKHSLVDYVED